MGQPTKKFQNLQSPSNHEHNILYIVFLKLESCYTNVIIMLDIEISKWNIPVGSPPIRISPMLNYKKKTFEQYEEQNIKLKEKY